MLDLPVAMHIPDGFLSPGVAAICGVLAIAAVAYEILADTDLLGAHDLELPTGFELARLPLRSRPPLATTVAAGDQEVVDV